MGKTLDELKLIISGKQEGDMFYCDGQYLDHRLNVRSNHTKYTIHGVSYYFNYQQPISVKMNSLQLLSDIERNAELLEAVKKAHEILLHEMDNGRTPSMLQGVGLGYFEDIICGVKS